MLLPVVGEGIENKLGSCFLLLQIHPFKQVQRDLPIAMALLYLVFRGIGLPFGEITGVNWVIIFIISLTTGSGAIFLYYFGLTRVRASVATICELCLPLSAVLLDYVVNDSILGAWQWVGAALLVGAILRITITPENGKSPPTQNESSVTSDQ